MTKKKLLKVMYRDKSDEFCPLCDSRTNVVGGHDESPGRKYEIRECSECKYKFILILSL